MRPRLVVASELFQAKPPSDPMANPKPSLSTLSNKDAKKLDEFWSRADWIEAYGSHYGHTGPRHGWEDWPDRVLIRAFGKIRPLLKPLNRPIAFPPLEGLEGDTVTIANTAHEAMFEILRYPDRLLGALPALNGQAYAVIRRAAEQELELLLPVRTETGEHDAVRPLLQGNFDDHGRLVLRCTRPDEPVRSRLISGHCLKLLLILSSEYYGSQTSGWDESIWDEMWGHRRRDGKKSEHYHRDVKTNGRDDGPPVKFRQAISSLNSKLREEFGSPPGQLWVTRQKMTERQYAYLLSEHVDWQLLPEHVDSVPTEQGMPVDKLDTLRRGSGRRKSKLPAAYEVD